MESLHSLWLSRVADRAQSVAVQDQYGAFTYSDLATQSFAWRDYFQARGLRRGERIVLVADASFASITILIGCSMCGLVFTVIAPDVPLARREAIVEDLQPSALVLDTFSIDHGPISTQCETAFERFAVLALAKASDELATYVSAAPISSDPCYIVFTSGSTGRPKGIVMSHRAVVAFWSGLIEHAQLAPSKRYASLSPLQFDFSLLDIGLCLGSGVALLLPNRSLLRKPALLVDQLVEWGVTHFSGVPTIWKLILQSASDSVPRLAQLERIAFAGEHFPPETMAAIHDLLPKVDFYNIYGQSESIACTFQVLGPTIFRSGMPHLPVGTGHKDMQLLLIDDEGNQVTAPGVPAELYLRGSTLFSGYWNNKEETERRLTQNPLHCKYADPVFRSGDICYFDDQGMFYFIGRKNNQIKINGNRVELEEIEAALNGFPDVLNSCVLVAEGDNGSVLHAALVVKNHGGRDFSNPESTLRSFLAAGLPAYMLPRYYHFVQTIPMSANGKNDRKKLSDILRLIA